jgi:hypothetical protein
MATSAIVTSWGAAVSGREQMGLGVFMGAIQFFTELKAKGVIEELRIYLARDGNLAQASGHMVVEGSDEQIQALVQRDDYRMLVLKAGHVVHELRTSVHGTGGAVMGQIELLQSARKELGI